MTEQTGSSANMRSAVTLMTASSLLVPVAGLLTQPVMARALGVDGRGELAAAVAPSVLALGVATLGLPDALTYFLAKRPSATRAAIAVASGISAILGMVCLFATFFSLPLLSAGDSTLAELILLAMLVTIPALTVGVLRGAATGRQMWTTVSIERVLTTVLRLGLLLGLFLAGELTVLAAVVVTVGVPVVCGVVYWRLLLPPPSVEDTNDAPLDPVGRVVISYGSRIWLGSIAAMLLSRTDQLLMVPLSSVEDLGIYTVANTISDVPFLVVTAIAGALIGVNSRTSSPLQVANTTRLTFLLATIGCAALAGLVPFTLVPLFGRDFESAIIPTLVLLLAAVVYAPGFIASAGLGAQGRPGLRSLALCIAFAVNMVAFFVTVPYFGVLGACWANLLTAVTFTAFTLLCVTRTTAIPARRFVFIGRSDFTFLLREVRLLVSRSKGGRSRSPQ